jgi:hypothetical protein
MSTVLRKGAAPLAKSRAASCGYAEYYGSFSSSTRISESPRSVKILNGAGGEAC